MSPASEIQELSLGAKTVIGLYQRKSRYNAKAFYAGPLIDGADRVYKGMEPGFPNLSIGIDENSNIRGVVDGLIAEESLSQNRMRC